MVTLRVPVALTKMVTMAPGESGTLAGDQELAVSHVRLAPAVYDQVVCAGRCKPPNDSSARMASGRATGCMSKSRVILFIDWVGCRAKIQTVGIKAKHARLKRPAFDDCMLQQ